MEGAMNRMMSGVVDFALGLAPEDVPKAARRDAALMLLDTLGVAAAAFPRTRDADVQITLNDGRVLDSGLVHARGGSERPMDESEIIAKFEDYASPVIGVDRARAIVAAVTGMADGTCGLDDLRAHLYAPA